MAVSEHYVRPRVVPKLGQSGMQVTHVDAADSVCEVSYLVRYVFSPSCWLGYGNRIEQQTIGDNM